MRKIAETAARDLQRGDVPESVRAEELHCRLIEVVAVGKRRQVFRQDKQLPPLRPRRAAEKERLPRAPRALQPTREKILLGRREKGRRDRRADRAVKQRIDPRREHPECVALIQSHRRTSKKFRSASSRRSGKPR